MSAFLGKVVVCMTAQGEINCIGDCVWYADHPTIGVNRDGVDQGSWAAHLARLATPEESIEYWKQRALKAEGK